MSFSFRSQVSFEKVNMQHKATIETCSLMTYVVPNSSHCSIHLYNVLTFLHVSSKYSNFLSLCEYSLLPPYKICFTSTRWHVMLTSLTGLRQRNLIKFMTLKSGQLSLAAVWHYLYIPGYGVQLWEADNSNFASSVVFISNSFL